MADQSSENPASHVPGSVPAVVAERAEWRVLSKPAGWHCVARAGAASEEGGESAPTVEEWLRTAYPEHADIPEAGIVHRLDLGTSG